MIPLFPADEKLLVEPTVEEIKAAEHLPYPNLLGVVQYPSNYTKLEMKYAMSILSRHRTKWGLNATLHRVYYLNNARFLFILLSDS